MPQISRYIELFRDYNVTGKFDENEVMLHDIVKLTKPEAKLLLDNCGILEDTYVGQDLRAIIDPKNRPATNSVFYYTHRAIFKRIIHDAVNFMNGGAGASDFTPANCKFLEMFLESGIHHNSFVYNGTEDRFGRRNIALHMGPRGIYISQPIGVDRCYNREKVLLFFSLNASESAFFEVNEYAARLYAFRSIIDAFNANQLVPNDHPYLV